MSPLENARSNDGSDVSVDSLPLSNPIRDNVRVVVFFFSTIFVFLISSFSYRIIDNNQIPLVASLLELVSTSITMYLFSLGIKMLLVE
jgi:hypothetical protein